MIRHLYAIIVLGSLAVHSSGQEAKKPAAKTETDVEVHFLNGSTVRLALLTAKIDIETPYGTLAVPIKDVRSIEFGSHLPEGYADKISSAVKKLASTDFREREKGALALLELGPHSYAAAVEASRAKDSEIAMRAKTVVQKLQAKHPKTDLKVSADDRIMTPTMPIVGRILTPTLKAKADYFGAAELNLADMRTLRAQGSAGPNVSVTLDASKYARAGSWLATDFHVDGLMPISITATGQIDLLPEEAGILVVGPSGTRILAGGGFAGGKGKVKGGAKTAPGTLIGKIGEDGPTIIIGDRYEGTPGHSGRLYLSISPSVQSNESAGSYEVRAAVKK